MKTKAVVVLVVVCVGLSMVGGEVAQAARPVQPVYWKGGAIAQSFKVEASSATSRIWDAGLEFTINCKSDTGAGEIEVKGRDKGELIFKECVVNKIKENAVTKKFEEEGAYANCKVKSPGAAAGEIKFPGLNSRLVWAEGENKILDLYEPAAPPFGQVAIENEGGICTPGGNYEVKGAVLGLISSINMEALTNNTLFEVKNENSKVVQSFTKWEAEEGGVNVKGTAELSFKFEGAPNAAAAALESVEQVQLVPVGGCRGTYGIHE